MSYGGTHPGWSLGELSVLLGKDLLGVDLHGDVDDEPAESIHSVPTILLYGSINFVIWNNRKNGTYIKTCLWHQKTVSSFRSSWISEINWWSLLFIILHQLAVPSWKRHWGSIIMSLNKKDIPINVSPVCSPLRKCSNSDAIGPAQLLRAIA